MGPNSAKFCILGSSPIPSISAQASNEVFGGYDKFLLESSLSKAGFDPSQGYYTLITPNIINELNSLPNLEVIFTLGEKALNLITGKYGIDKWHLSPLDTVKELRCHKCMPTFDFTRLNRQYENRFFFFHAFVKAAANPGLKWKRKPAFYTLITEPDDLQIDKYLKNQPILSVDIETGKGAINTMGVAWSPSHALAVRIDPGKYPPQQEFQFWKTIAKYMEDEGVKKILQNNIYEGTYFSRYGIELKNVWHDTMWAQKLLYPEFKQGLDTVGRLYTNEVYWKEDGKDWSNITNWQDHLIYNCKDTSNTFEAALNQRKELEDRNLLNFYDNYMIKLAHPLIEMCSQGLIVDKEKLNELKAKTQLELKELVSQLSTPFNHRSPKQKLTLLESKGYKIPKSRNSKGKYTKSTNELSLKKMRLNYPHDLDIQLLLKLAKLEKFKSSYLDFDYHDDGVVRYSISGSGTETLRFSSGTDSWGMGFNAQTIPKKAKPIFIPPKNHLFFQVDLKQAESRYVAYISRDMDLISMLEDPNQDVHSYVASHVFNCSIEQVLEEAAKGNKDKRQLGKKSGHGANYAMKATTFMESCLKEDLILTHKEADNVLETYHRLFPGIRNWHREVRQKIKNQGYLENPLGFRRYFYGRHDDNTFREAYAFEPQSTIPMVTNHLLLGLLEQRELGLIDFNIHLQVHDSIVLSAKEDQLSTLRDYALNTDLWHPKIVLPAGTLVIPTDVEIGPNLGNMKAIN